MLYRPFTKLHLPHADLDNATTGKLSHLAVSARLPALPRAMHHTHSHGHGALPPAMQASSGLLEDKSDDYDFFAGVDEHPSLKDLPPAMQASSGLVEDKTDDGDFFAGVDEQR